MPLDHYVTLGRSGLRVSPFCLGAMTFGPDLGWGSSVEESTQILDRYLAGGGNFIDTANFYTRGHSEKIIGDHIGRHPEKRNRVVIATKFFSSLYTGDPNAGFPADFIANGGSFGFGGTTINGRKFPANPLAPSSDAERY